MPDGPRESFPPTVRNDPVSPQPEGFTAANTSGVSDPELVSLNWALCRIMKTGLSEHEGKLVLDAAVRRGMKPADAGVTDLNWLLDGP